MSAIYKQLLYLLITDQILSELVFVCLCEIHFFKKKKKVQIIYSLKLI